MGFLKIQGRHLHTGRQEKLVRKHGQEHPNERKIQRGRAPAESVHDGFPLQKEKINEGEVPQYYVEHNHDAIIEPAVFEAVQKQMAVRQTGTNRQSSVGIFSSKIKCGDCGS